MHIVKPIQQGERAQVLDVLRGLALLGILLNNIYGFSGFGNLPDEARQKFSTFSLDEALNFFQVVLVEGKFYSLFSLLFGIGFSIILVRNEKKGLNPYRVFYRRLAVLFLIGAAHIYFLWEGDILFLYALIGFILPLFRKSSNRALIIWAFIFILSPIGIDGLKLLWHWAPGDPLQHFAEGIDAKKGIVGEEWRTFLFKEGSGWKEWRTYQETGFMYRFSSLLNNNRIPKVLGMFLLGFYVGRNMIYANLERHKKLLKRLMLWGFIMGIPFSFAMAFFEGDDKEIYSSAAGMLDTLCYALGVVPLSIAYAASISLWWLRRQSSFLKLFAPVGRMALTNYIIQTLMGTVIFFGAGFGLGQEFGISYCFIIALLIYCVQVIYSNLWFRYFQYGPLEWIWRQLTYGKQLSLKKV